jgi:HK97 family phage major capsid protein
MAKIFTSLREAADERNNLVTKMRDILDGAKKEGRGINTDEKTNVENIERELNDIEPVIEGFKTDVARRKRIADAVEDYRTMTLPRPSSGDKKKKGARRAKVDRGFTRRELRREYHAGLRAFASYEKGVSRTKDIQQRFKEALEADDEQREVQEEYRGYQADLNVAGGFATLPLQLISEIITKLKDYVFVRKMAQVVQVASAQSLGCPTLDTDPSDSDWTAEVLTGNEETTATLGRRDLSPKPISKLLRISHKLARLNPNVTAMLLDRLAYKMGVTEEKAFLLGTGINQPLGVFVASALGISTARDFSVTGTATGFANSGGTGPAPGAQALITAFFGLKQQYQQDPSCAWIIARFFVSQIRQLVDNQGRYLWQPFASSSIEDNAYDTILGKPVCMSEYAPSTAGNNNYYAAVGAWRYYMIADALTYTIQRLDELYAASNQVGFILRRELDAMPIFEEAFARVQGKT